MSPARKRKKYQHSLFAEQQERQMASAARPESKPFRLILGRAWEKATYYLLLGLVAVFIYVWLTSDSIPVLRWAITLLLEPAALLVSLLVVDWCWVGWEWCDRHEPYDHIQD